MKKFSMLAALAAAMVSMFAVGSAQAANWQVSPAGGAFTGTGGAMSYSIRNGTRSCTSSSLSGTVTGSGGGIANGPLSAIPWNGVASVTLAFAGCTTAGINYTVRCGAASLNANAGGYNGGVTTTQAASAGLSTGGSITGLVCTIKPTAAPSTNCTTITGSLPATYTNSPSLAAGTGAADRGRLTTKTAGQSLTAASVGGCVSDIGTGSTTFSQTTYAVSGSPSTTVAAPDIWAG